LEFQSKKHNLDRNFRISKLRHYFSEAIYGSTLLEFLAINSKSDEDTPFMLEATLFQMEKK